MTFASSRSLRTFVTWMIISGALAFIIYRNAHSPTARNYESRLADARSRVLALLAVEIKNVEKPAGTEPTSRNTGSREIIRRMEQEVQSPEDSVRLAIMTGEIIGAGSALERLQALTTATLSPELADDVATVQKIYLAGKAALNSEAADRLVRRYGYIGQVALAYGVEPNLEPRKSVNAAARRFTVKALLLAAGLALLGLFSLGLFITALVLVVLGKIQPSYVPDPSLNHVFLEDFAIYLVLFLFLGLMLRLLGAVSLHWEWLALLILPVVGLWNRRHGFTSDAQRMALGWHQGRGWLKEAGAGLAGYCAGLPIIALGALMTAVLSRITGKFAASPVIDFLRGGFWHTIGLLALLCIFAPVMEETMFRGALFHHLRRRWSWMASAPAVSLVFALMHPQGWVAVPALGAIAIVLAGLREWRGSLIAPMAAHACSNFLVTVVALLLLD